MPLIEPNGRPYIARPRCKTNVVWLEAMSSDDKRAIAAACRGSPFESAQLAQQKFGLGIREAKALAFHITRSPGICHRCGSAVEGEVVVCSNCRSANLNW